MSERRMREVPDREPQATAAPRLEHMEAVHRGAAREALLFALLLLLCGGGLLLATAVVPSLYAPALRLAGALLLAAALPLVGDLLEQRERIEGLRFLRTHGERLALVPEGGEEAVRRLLLRFYGGFAPIRESKR